MTFHQHRGMRIDLALVSEPLAERITWAVIDRNARKGKLPSDHAPLIVDFGELPSGRRPRERWLYVLGGLVVVLASCSWSCS